MKSIKMWYQASDGIEIELRITVDPEVYLIALLNYRAVIVYNSKSGWLCEPQ